MKQKQNRKESKFKTFVKRHLGILTLVFAFVLFMLTVTFSWYQNQVSLEGNTFQTGTIDFISRGYDENGNLVTTILQDSKDPSGYEKVNLPLFKHTGWTAKMEPETSYLVIERTGSLEMDYKISFSANGSVEYLGGFWYALTDVTNEVVGSNGSSSTDYEALLQAYIEKNNSPKSETDGYNMATMDRYATIGSILDTDNHNAKYYRLDYGMKSSAIMTEYTNLSVEVFAKIFVTQVGALESEDGTGYTYNCTSQLDIEKAREQALPGDNIVLLNNITYEGDLVFNKGVNLFANNYTLEVLGNLIYEYVAATDLTINVSGNGRILVSCPREGVGGNFTVEAPNSNVTIIGSNTSNGDIVTESRFTISGTHAYGASGVTLRNLKVMDPANSARKVIYVNSNSRITVTDNTTIFRLEAVSRATNIEIQNMGNIQEISLTNMYILSQTLSPQIYIYNMGVINQTIQLPSWSIPFKVINPSPLECTGNTKIVQAITGNDMTVSGATVYDAFTTEDIEKESIDETVVPMGDSDTQLIIYYQNVKKQGNLVETTVQSLLEDYFTSKGITNIASALAEITDIKVVSVDGKRVLNGDIQYLRSGALPYLVNLDLERAILYDTNTSRENRLFDNAFYSDNRIKNLVLPQRLEAIGTGALHGMSCDNIIRIPESVTEFGANWFRATKYVCFESPTPPVAAYSDNTGLYGIKAIFVEEPYIAAYRQTFTSYSNIIYCVGQKDDSGNYFVRRNSQGNDWEIVYYTGAQGNITSLSVGSDIRISGQLLTIANIGENAFCNTLPDSVTTIRFADTIRVIGKGAFYGKAITSVESWGTSLTTIDSSAFEKCSLLKGKVTLPSTMKTIESYAFSDCSMLEGINTGGTTLIRTAAFQNCTSLIYADMPSVNTFETVSILGVFRNCSMLVSVKAPSLRKTVGLVFWDLPSIREYVFGSDFEEVENEGFCAFRNAVNGNTKIFFDVDDLSLISIVEISSDYFYLYGEKIDELLVNGYNIGKYIVRDDNNGGVVLSASNIDYVSSSNVVEAISLPDEFDGKIVTEIGPNAFRQQNFDKIKIVFGSNLKRIDHGAFCGRTGLKDLDFTQATSLKSIGYSAFEGSGIEGKVQLSDGLSEIENTAFFNCVALTEVNTGGATYIGIAAFANCGALVLAELPEVLTTGVADVESRIFENCSNLVAVYMPKVYEIRGYYTFRACTSLRELHFASSSRSFVLDHYSFYDTDRSKIKVYVPEELVSLYRNKDFADLQINSVFAEGEKIGNNPVNGYNIGDYIVKRNDDGSATLITSRLELSGAVSIPATWNDGGTERKITVIGENAFKSNTFSNVTLSFSDNLIEIGTDAFHSVTGLVNVAHWGSSLQTISSGAFYDCKELQADVVLPETCVSIGDSAFSYCGIKSVSTGGATSIGRETFIYCTNLVWADLPNVVTIGTENEANSTFARCSKLVSVKMPKLVSAKGGSLFIVCTSLREIYLGAPDFDALSDNAFEQAKKENIKIFVPENLYDYYVTKNPGGIGTTRIYPIGEKYGEYLVNGFDVGKYVIKLNADGQSATLVTSHTSFTGDVPLPDKFDDVPITAIYKNAFVNQSFSDVNLTVGEYVRQIGESAFDGRTGILSVNLKYTESVLRAAFRNCSDMNNLVANYLKTISGGNSFDGCKSLTVLTLPKLETVTGIRTFANDTSLQKVYLQNIKAFGGGDFYFCTNLVEFVINKKIEQTKDIPTAPSAVFSADVPAVLPIKVPANSVSFYSGSWQSRPVQSYGDNITVGNDSYVVLLTEDGYIIQSYIGLAETVVLPDTLNSVNVIGLEANAFEIVTQSITSVKLPKHLYILGNDALSEISSLEEILVNENNRFFSSAAGVLYSKDGKMLVKYPCGKTDLSYTVYDSAVAIGANAFKKAINLQTVVFGNSLSVIDSTAFVGCTALKQVTFTGAVPPVLMGAAMFDTKVVDFAMTVPTESIDTYIRAMNFAEYAPYINGDTEIPADGDMNLIYWEPAIVQQQNSYALSPKKEDDDEDIDDDEGEPETEF